MALANHRNIQAEVLLDELGLTWELTMLPLDQINKQASRANQARFEAISTELLGRYHADYKAGAKFPAIICGINGTGKQAVIADGNHRDEILRRNEATDIPAYVFTYKDEDAFRAVADLANVRLNGLGNSLLERLEHASRACERTGITIRDAAQLFGIPTSTLANYRKARQLKLVLREELAIGPRYWKDISDGHLADLGGVVAEDAWIPVLTAIQGGVSAAAMITALRSTSDIATQKKRGEAQIQIAQALAEEQRTAKKLLNKKRPGTSRDPVLIDTMQLRAAHKVITKTLKDPTPEQKELLDAIHALFK